MPVQVLRSLFAASALALLAGFAPTAAAQSAAGWGAARPAASPASSQDAADAAGPRRRPTRRSAVQTDTPPTAAYRAPVRSVSSASASASSARAEMISSALRDAGQPWLGTPYRWGGDSRRGIDCSAFVRQFMQDNLGVELPRATDGQQFEGVSVQKGDLLPGDLVFFRRRSVRHVGVYLGNGDFIHASSSRGVTVSNLDEGYYQQAYWMARRVLAEPASGRRPTPRRDADSEAVRG